MLVLRLEQFWGYGHRRFANPADLNGATGWLFLNDPGDVQWVCASNTRNYSRRYLPVCLPTDALEFLLTCACIWCST
jgi:hypothetical protein